MDARHFDRFARSLAAAATRRGLLSGLLAGILTPLLPALAAKRGKQRGKHKPRARGKRQKRRSPRRVQAQAACFSGAACIPGPGAYLAKCDFGGSNALENVNCTGCNLSEAGLKGADASGASFKKANLSKACLVDADLTGANLSNANLLGAIFCRTTMPNGSINNSGCSKGASCCPICDAEHPCPTGQACCNGRCRSVQCCIDAHCDPGETCCEQTCVDTQTDPVNCGGCGLVCLVPPNATATCINGVCGFTCDFVPCQGGCCPLGQICSDGCCTPIYDPCTSDGECCSFPSSICKQVGADNLCCGVSGVSPCSPANAARCCSGVCNSASLICV
jgi:hypothetical protein